MKDKLKVDAFTGVTSDEISGRHKVYLRTADKLMDKVDFKEIPYVDSRLKLNIPYKYIVHNLLFYPRIAKKYIRNDSDIIHFFSQEETYLAKSIKTNKPKIATCLDIIGLTLNEYDILDRKFKSYSINAMKDVDKIITISDFTKNELINYTNISPNKIKTIYLGVDNQFKQLSSKEIEDIRMEYKLPNSYILYVGSEQSRKNFISIIKAFYNLKKKYNLKDLKLIKAGSPQISDSQRNKIFDLIKELNLEKDIIFTNYVSEEYLVKLYNAADIFVYPSLYEGFGLPPLEAMACGCPVITSNTSSLPEVVGDAGIMINPYDIDSLTESIHKILADNDLKKELSKKSLERAKFFNWKKTADQTLEVYEEVLHK
ncbi:MAG: glycosyltransferase family 1 protein [Methanobacterium sp.]|uniref:glycosyltransferase family 4 protein n=1 Tax=Methanobacterium sp. TaxID=2164 RepID=UPI003C72A0C9